MQQEQKIWRHPPQRQLVSFAEALADKTSAPVSAEVAAHVAKCAVCAEEVRSIRASLEFSASAPPLKPSNELTAQIMMQAQQARQETHPVGRYAARALWQVGKGTVCAAMLAVIATAVFVGVAKDGRQTAARADTPAAAAVRQAEARPAGPSAEEIETLSSAVWLIPRRTPTARERKHLRDAYVMDAEVDAALTALERNPGCDRAAAIVRASRVRQAKALRDFYVERSL